MLLSIGGRLRLEIDLFTQARLLMAWVAQMRRAAIGRRAIAQMDDRMLSDVGLSRAEASVEINRRPWDITPKARQGLRDI
jgi:uncharacterized protein YjiS (DUF1127 family)